MGKAVGIVGFEVDQTFASQRKVREMKRAKKGPAKGTKYKHDNAIGMHHSRRTGMCMCLDTCCQDEAGCKCKTCRCRQGEYNHGDVIPDAGTFEGQEESEILAEQEEMREVRPRTPSY
jgi:hypothetical protein